MKVRLKEDINIKELAENSWNGCRNSTLDFIKIFYNAGSEQDIFVTNKSNGEFYSINTVCREYKVNIEALEIIEEDKEIEKIDRVNGSYLVDLQSDSSIAEQSEAITSLVMYLNNIADKLNEVIPAVNELKKGK